MSAYAQFHRVRRPLLVPAFLLALVAILGLAGAAPAAAGDAADDARALLLGLADAVQPGQSCDDLVAALGARLAVEGDRIARLAATGDGDGTQTLSAAEQAKVDAYVARVRTCGRTPGGRDLATAVAPLGARRATLVSAADDSGCDCSDWCPQGWETWAEVSEMTLACLGGDDQACCTATAIASYTACINTYCPEEDCCLGVPVNPPPPPE